MIYCGIDVGKKGALAIIKNHETEVIPYDKELYIDKLKKLKREDDMFVIIERVHAMPMNGSVSMFSFGETFGWLQGVCEALRIPYELVRPNVWKKEFGVTADKNTSIAVAKRLFPDVSLRRTERSTREDDNIAEAALMAEYGRRKYREVDS